MRKAKEVTYTKEDLEKYTIARSGLSCLEQKLFDKIDDVFSAIMEAFGIAKEYKWWFNNADEGEVGDPCVSSDVVEDCRLEMYNNQPKLETSKWDYYSSFPTEYLFMARRDIVGAI
jgi:hypothetical protein